MFEEDPISHNQNSRDHPHTLMESNSSASLALEPKDEPEAFLISSKHKHSENLTT